MKTKKNVASESALIDPEMVCWQNMPKEADGIVECFEEDKGNVLTTFNYYSYPESLRGPYRRIMKRHSRTDLKKKHHTAVSLPFNIENLLAE